MLNVRLINETGFVVVALQVLLSVPFPIWPSVIECITTAIAFAAAAVIYDSMRFALDYP